MDWTVFLTSVGVSGALFATFAFLTRSVILHYLSKDIDRHKAELLRTTNEHQIRFNRVYEKQAEVIAEFYRRLVTAKRLLGCLRLTDSQTLTNKDKAMAEDAFSAYWDALTYFDNHALYFDDQVCQKVLVLNMKMLKYTSFFSGLVEMMQNRFTEEERQQLNSMKIEGVGIERHLIETWKTMDDEIAPLLRDLVKEFRGLLGVIDRTK